MCLTPHSSGAEGAMSIHTTFKTNKQSTYIWKQSYGIIEFQDVYRPKGVGTAFFDPRPPVAMFLQAKERRQRLPDKDLYKHHDYIVT